MDKEDNIALEYAGFWQRLAAMLIDGVVILSINWIMAAPWRWAFIILNPSEGILKQLAFIDPFATLLVLTSAIYFVVFWTWRGQTPGKIILNIKVLKTDGQRLTLSVALLRYLGYILSILTLGIGFIILAFDERRQGLHDKLALSVVVKIPPVKARLPEPIMG